MGTDFVADIIGNIFGQSFPNLPSRASNASDAIVDLMGPGPGQFDILSAYITPQSSQAGSATHFANVLLINVGSAGSGTTVLASKTFSAATTSVAAHGHGSFALSSTVSKGSAEGLAVSYASQGNGIALVPHAITVLYRRT